MINDTEIEKQLTQRRLDVEDIYLKLKRLKSGSGAGGTQVNSDWNATSGAAQILNKPTIPAAQIQSDWNQVDTNAKDYIKNKPTITSSKHGFGAYFNGASAGDVVYINAPVGGTISAWNILVDTGTCTIKVWRVGAGTAIPTSANSINTSGLSISNGTAIHSTTLTDFTNTTIADEDLIGIELVSISGATQIFFNVELS